MNNFREWIALKENRPPHQSMNDRSLEGFRHSLDTLKIQAKGVMEPNLRSQIWSLLNPFYSQMEALLKAQQGAGYGPGYQYQPPQ